MTRHVFGQVRRVQKLTNVASSSIRLAIFFAFAAALLWTTLSRSFIPSFSAASPWLTLISGSDSPDAVIAFVQTELMALDVSGVASNATTSHASRHDAARSASGLDAASLHAMRQRIETALAAAPLNPRLYSLLALLAERGGDTSRAADLMRISVRLSRHDTIALDWLMRERFNTGDLAEATAYAALLLQNDYALTTIAAPLLTQIAERDDGVAYVAKLLIANPVWRSRLFEKMTETVTNVRTPLKLMLAMKDAGEAPLPDEIRPYLSFLFARKHYQLAYYTWLQFLSLEQIETAGFLFNGGFRYPVSGAPFDWMIKSGVGYTVDIVSKEDADGNHGLNVRFDEGRVEFNGISQTTMLQPGRYALKGVFRGSVIGPRGLQWTIRCLDGGLTGEGAALVGIFSAWQPFVVPFTVPARGCAAQDVQLTFARRTSPEALVSGSVWFNDLSIERDTSTLQ